MRQERMKVLKKAGMVKEKDGGGEVEFVDPAAAKEVLAEPVKHHQVDLSLVHPKKPGEDGQAGQDQMPHEQMPMQVSQQVPQQVPWQQQQQRAQI